jgi:rhodanese-related sulfurtransferase
MSERLPPVHVVPGPIVARRLAGGEPITLLDVREDDERALCRIAPIHGAADHHVPIGQVPHRLDEIREAARGRTLVVYCHHGIRSMVAARWLSTQGLDPVENLEGGIDAWSMHVDPAVPRYHL